MNGILSDFGTGIIFGLPKDCVEGIRNVTDGGMERLKWKSLDALRKQGKLRVVKNILEIHGSNRGVIAIGNPSYRQDSRESGGDAAHPIQWLRRV
jgi:hypothetical protein